MANTPKDARIIAELQRELAAARERIAVLEGAAQKVVEYLRAYTPEDWQAFLRKHGHAAEYYGSQPSNVIAADLSAALAGEALK